MNRTRVAVIDYGMGNLHSVAKALEHVAPDAAVHVTSNPDVIRAADRVVFPGVGAIRDCMAEIHRLGVDALVREAIAQKPVLAICVGMQALMAHSEENGGVDCLDILPGHVKFFGKDLRDERGERLKVPHMGWNEVTQTVAHPLWQKIPQGSRFYFVHSYYVTAAQRDCVVAACDYGVTFDAALASGHLFAVQFHPEKSHTAGLQLLENFMNWNGSC
ncbi:MAG TPA: imidazole glycerol phosphate synthase subunit HisH [Pseudomonadales bacterium]|nr:imidazole glycerol phosphate synthase subunit HisH [Pseudomonadales bacterium]